MDTPGKGSGGAIKFRDGAIKFVIYFTFVSGAVAFGGIVIGLENKSATIVIGTLLLMIVIDIGMMLVVRKRAKRRSQIDGRRVADIAHTRQSELPTLFLAGTGTVLGGVGIYLNLANVADPSVSLITGLIGAALVVTAGYRALRKIK